MKRRSFFRQLFGAVVAGFAAPHLGASAAKSIAVIDPAAPIHFPMRGGMYAADQPLFRGRFVHHRMKGGVYKPGDTFEIIGPRGPGTGPLHKVAITK